MRWLHAQRYPLLLLAVLLMATSVAAALVYGVRLIRDSLPVSSLHQQRDFSALLIDVTRLKHSVDLLIAQPSEESIEQAQFSGDLARSRMQDTCRLFEQDQPAVQQVCNNFKQIDLGLERVLINVDQPFPRGLRIIPGLHQLQIPLGNLLNQVRHLNDEMFQQSAEQVALQRDRLAKLRSLVIFYVISSAIGTVLLVISLSRQRRAFNELQAMDDKVRTLALRDPLTGLANRSLLMSKLHAAQLQSQASGLLGAILLLDLDRFKSINDTDGHDAGDRLLLQVAQRLSEQAPAGAIVARFGGDEFVVLLENLGTTTENAAIAAEHLAEQIRAVLKQPFGTATAGTWHHTSPSIGVALFEGVEESPDLLIKQADLALYEAKDAGRDTIRFFSPSMQALLTARINLEAALRSGIEKRQFRLFLQPQVNPQGQWVGAEALVRWDRPGHGIVNPGEFIEIAEESGLIIPLGSQVLEMALNLLTHWTTVPALRELALAVNVSAKQFAQPHFVHDLQHLLQSTGAPPQKLKLELTETVVLNDLQDTQTKMCALRDLGVGLALDDFGTGYSSLAYLKQLPFNVVKIDQSFVRDIGHDRSDEAICSAVIFMAHELGMTVIAEGVETEDQSVFLTRLHNCDLMQGYWFGRPQPIADFEQHMENR